MSNSTVQIATETADKLSKEELYEDAFLHQEIGAVKHIHNWLIKPITYLWSSRKLRGEVRKMVGVAKGKRIIDVSAGDDPTILDFANEAKEVVINDISIYAMLPLIKRNGHRNVAFTTENIINLDLSNFDVAVFKNTLHHFATKKLKFEALRRLKEVKEKIILMDVEEPEKYWYSRLWNRYYRYLLKDQGENFLEYKEFKDLVLSVFLKEKVRFKKIKTIKGIYMLAEISQL